jgi:flagellar hook assembly protein FlgD
MITMLTSCAVKKPIIITEEVELEPAAAKLTISNVSVDRKTFNPFQGETVKIRYRLSKQANVAIKIYDSDDNLVRILKQTEIDKQGYNEKIWDGRDDAGSILPKEVYIYTIEATDTSKNEAYTYDMADETGGIELTLRGLKFDNKTGEISYVLPKAARVRIRIGIKDGGPLLRTLLDWQPQEAGRHTLVWDGMDSSGVMNLLGNPNVFVNIASFSLPENSVILERGDESDYEERISTEKRLAKSVTSKKYIHALHKRAKCHEPNFDFEILGLKEYNKKGIPLITQDIIPIRIIIEQKDKIDLINSRFEIIFFIDNVFIFEEEEGTSPFTYRFDTKGLSEGEHIITVNIYGFNDHIASRSQRILIQSKR